MANTFLTLRNSDTSVQLFFHDGQNISPTGLGALPGAILEPIISADRGNTKQINRTWVLLDSIFALNNGIIYESTDEGATFAVDHTLVDTTPGDDQMAQGVGPIPVMVLGALKLIGAYITDTTEIGIMTYDVAAGTWASVNTGISSVNVSRGNTLPIFFNGLVYFRCGQVFGAYDPVSTGTISLSSSLVVNAYGSDQIIEWNGALWSGPHQEVTANAGMARLVGSTWDIDTNGADFSVGATQTPRRTSKSGVFIDPVTNNLIVMWTSNTQVFRVMRITPGLVVTDITGTVAGAGLAALGAFSLNTRFWPHITRSPGGAYSVVIYAARGADPTDPVEKFEWVDDATQITEDGIVGGSGEMAFPYAIDGGDQYGFFAAEKRVAQTAQAANPTGITVTCEAFQQGGTTLSVRGHFDKEGVDANSLTLSPMTLSNPTGTGGLSVSGVNPGAQIDGVPADRTPISMDWNQVTDGFATGDNYNFQLEAL